jgi:hypothetical protein
MRCVKKKKLKKNFVSWTFLPFELIGWAKLIFLPFELIEKYSLAKLIFLPFELIEKYSLAKLIFLPFELIENCRLWCVTRISSWCTDLWSERFNQRSMVLSPYARILRSMRARVIGRRLQARGCPTGAVVQDTNPRIQFHEYNSTNTNPRIRVHE